MSTPAGMNLHPLIGYGADLLEALGVLVLVGAVVLAAARVLWRVRRTGWRGSFNHFRMIFGHGILLGLEFLVAADIIRTITEELILTQVASLALIILIRTFLSVMMEIELEGRLPWHRYKHDSARQPGAQEFASKEEVKL